MQQPEKKLCGLYHDQGPGTDSVKGGKTYFISQFQKVHHEGGQIQRECLTHGGQRKQMPAWPTFTLPLLFHKEPSPKDVVPIFFFPSCPQPGNGLTDTSRCVFLQSLRLFSIQYRGQPNSTTRELKARILLIAWLDWAEEMEWGPFTKTGH